MRRPGIGPRECDVHECWQGQTFRAQPENAEYDGDALGQYRCFAVDESPEDKLFVHSGYSHTSGECYELSARLVSGWHLLECCRTLKYRVTTSHC